MRKRWTCTTLSAVLVAGLLASSSTYTHANDLQTSSKESKTPVSHLQQAHPEFGWGTPGPSSPILHPGSVRGAGMVAEPLNEIDSVMPSMIDGGVMPGAVTFVARSGHIVQHEAYGESVRYKDDSGKEFENPTSMNKDTIFDIASLSKIFTTVAAMKLYEDEAFQLDDPVSAYIPEFSQNGKSSITIRQLMTHTSGFPSWAPLYTIGETREDRLQYVFESSLDNEPGTRYTYSDLNMITLGALIERISGMSLDQFVSKTITEPLNMTDTMYNPQAKIKERIAATEYQPWTDRGLVWGEVHDENAWSLDGVAGHAGVFSTAEDLAKLGHMMLNKGRYGSKQILKPESVALLVENQLTELPDKRHGLGWEIGEDWYMDALTDTSAIGHTGYTGTSMVINRDNNTIAILLTNRVHPTRETVSTNPARRQFARKVADAIPVKTPQKQETWFSGYGDDENQSLIAKVDVRDTTALSFDTWLRMDNNDDFGAVEVSEDGESWTTAGSSFTGASDNWNTHRVTIPNGTRYIRFLYSTDGYANGRGWYISGAELDNGQPLQLSSDGWIKRDY